MKFTTGKRATKLQALGVAVLAAIASLALAISAAAETFSVGSGVSESGETVAEFSASTAPGHPDFMAASAIKRISEKGTALAVYVSRDGGNIWREVPAWPEGDLRPEYDPQVVIDRAGIIHAAGVGRTSEGSRAMYTESRDHGKTWTPARAVTPFPAPFKYQSEDKPCLAVGPDGTVYIVFNEILTKPSEKRGLILARSTDQGQTWITSDTGGAGFPNGIVAGPNGAVTVTFVLGALPGYGTVTSTDGGDTWKKPVNLGDVNFDQGLSLPSMVRDAGGRIVIGNLDGEKARLKIFVEHPDGSVAEQWELPLPPGEGRLIQPVIADHPKRSPAFQIARKVDATPEKDGHMTIWIYPNVDEHDAPPVQVKRLPIPAAPAPSEYFSKRFNDGGDYWGLTWSAKGWLSMWVDGRAAQGPGALRAVPVTPID